MNIIEVRDLTKIYNKKKNSHFFKKDYDNLKAVNNISFKVKEGENVAFIGPNGAGKSTTIKVLTGILYPSSGKISVAGVDPSKKRNEFVRRIGVVFGQRSQLWWDLPAEDSFKILKEIYNIPQSTYEKNLKLFDSILELKKIIKKPVRQMSLGQRMRCEFVAAFLHNPKIVFLDEPTIGLDIVAKEKISEFIKYINKEKNVTTILTTHDLQDVENICDRIIIIDHGDIIYDGGLNAIKRIAGEKKYLSIELKDDIPILFPDIQLIKTEGKRKYYVFYADKIDIVDIITYISKKTEIKDIEIKAPPIEDIIKEMYLSDL